MQRIGFILLSIVMTLFQTGKGQECNLRELCRLAIPNDLSKDKRILLYQNWNDYFGIDLEQDFPILSGQNLNVFSIRFDGLGCIYPSFINNSTHRESFIDKHRSERKFDKLSFYRFLRNNPRLLDNEMSEKLNEELNNTLAQPPGADSYYDFRDLWNKQFLQPVVDSLNSLIKKKSSKRVFFFIHGFNVPYSLAHLQGNAFFRKILEDTSVKAKDVLFVRVFWPSLSLKRKDFLKDEHCNIKNKQFQVFLSRLFSYVSNRAYLCGATLNEIVRTLPNDVQYNFISHSFGSSLSAAMLFSPRPKMNEKQLNTPYNQRLLALFYSKPTLAEKNLNFFMNAPGMPGIGTFKSVSSQNNQNHRFFIGYNEKDKILLKKILWFKLSAKMSSTTLGSNHNHDADSLRRLVAKKGLTANFEIAPTKNSPEHDVFCYMQQIQFDTLFKQFLKLK